jgi:ribosomal 50S subunit-recycling heat shock protein
MRIDKFLKVSRIIKRRSVANQACDAGAIKINGKDAKPGSKVDVGDKITVALGSKVREYEVLLITDTMPKDGASEMYKELT